MPTFNTEAIVLAKKELFESDRLYILYSPEYGKVEARVKAAASTSSKLAGSLEPIVKSQVMLINGRSLETIGGAQIIKNYFFNGLLKQSQLAIVRELFIRLLKPGLPEKTLYEKLAGYLDFLEASSDALSVVATQRFIWQMLKILGYASESNVHLSKITHQFSETDKLLLNACLAENGAGLKSFEQSDLGAFQRFTNKYLEYFLESGLRSTRFVKNHV